MPRQPSKNAPDKADRAGGADEKDQYDARAHQGCYIFSPATATATAPTPRPSKRRKTAKQNVRTEIVTVEQRNVFPQLLSGAEKSDTIKLRWEAYRRLWKEQESRINDTLDLFNKSTLDNVSGFVAHAEPEKYEGKIPTALILAGPNIAFHEPLFAQIAKRIKDVDHAGPAVVLTSKDATNLKATLKKLIRGVTQQDEGVDDDDNDELIMGSKGSKLLNYDLQIVQNWCALNPQQKVVIAIQDTEAFDSGVLADLISLFSAYLDRIPFVLLFGVATSIELFHEKIPKAVIRKMSGERFDVERADECFAQVFTDAVISDKAVLKLGASLCGFLLERCRDHTQSIQAFIAALKYAYMAHFYANALSIILAFDDDPEGLKGVLTDAHIEAIRMLPSFRHLVESKLDDKQFDEVRALLDDKEYMCNLVGTAAKECRAYTASIGEALRLIEIIRAHQQHSTSVPCHELYAKFIAGELDAQSPMVRELLLALKKANSTSLLGILEAVADASLPTVGAQVGPPLEEIKQLVAESVTAEGKDYLTSEFNTVSSTTQALRSTAVSKKIQLEKHTRSLTKADAAYSKIVQAVYDKTQAYLATTLTPLDDVFLHEVYFYDLLSPHRDVFAARSRPTIERALTHPIDYLACECCNIDDETDGHDPVTGTMPSTSIVYKLSLESGLLINCYDLWSAYWSVVSEEGEKDISKETAQAMFYRSVAEMRWLGLVKGTKKRVDHIQKVAWKGL